jgi:hypothetical protein
MLFIVYQEAYKLNFKIMDIIFRFSIILPRVPELMESIKMILEAS